MKNLKKVLALSLSLSLALPLAACGDQGETGKGGGSTGSYPSSTITVVCPWDAGGTSDGLCRIVSEIGARDEYFGVNMVVQNSGGAGGAGMAPTSAGAVGSSVSPPVPTSAGLRYCHASIGRFAVSCCSSCRASDASAGPGRAARTGVPVGTAKSMPVWPRVSPVKGLSGNQTPR